MKYAKWISTWILLLMPGIAAAQLQENDRIVTQVPFRFEVANTVIPAGQCAVQRAEPTGRVLVVSNHDAKVNIFATASPQEGKKPAGTYSLVFHKYGDRYFLAAIELEGSRVVYTLNESKLEAEMRAQNVPAEEILLASVK